jgi:hypothetical protein
VAMEEKSINNTTRNMHKWHSFMNVQFGKVRGGGMVWGWGWGYKKN